MSLLPRSADEGACGCRPSFVEVGATGTEDRVELRIDADDCASDGDLVDEPACRATTIDALADRDADAVRVRSAGYERWYTDEAVGLLHAAGRFAALVEHHDAELAATARTDPLAAAHEATGRTGPVGRLAAETGLASGAGRADGYDAALRSHDGPTIARAKVDHRPPADARLRDTTALSTGGTVRRYALEADADPGARYHLTPVSASFDARAFELLDEAATWLAESGETGNLAPARAVRRVADADAGRDADVPLADLSATLRKHTRGNGVLADLFADERVSDAYVTAPAAETPIRVVVDGETMPTNVRLTPEGVGALASRVRRASGRAFSRSTPQVDATLSIGPPEDREQVRVAGVTRPLSPGPAFAVRRHDSEPWTLPRLVATGSLSARAAALLSLAVERGSTGLVAGARGAGKTTTLGALLWALPRRTRTVLIEDTPELPAAALRAAGRDVQSLRVARGDDDSGETSPASALRTALRLGEGALIVGEVRGEEAGTLYEAMRVGAASGTVLGTVHGDGAEAVRTRMTEDLDVGESAFAATGFVLTLADTERGRRAVAIEEVESVADGTELHPLFELDDDGDLEPTGRLDRGESSLLTTLTTPAEDYGGTLAALADRADHLGSLASDGVTRPAAIRAERPTDRADPAGEPW
ncbi:MULTISPECIES: ATPase, T2SS/T4P/T4SS family [Halolamina]|uniref:Type IV secretory pathway ATPase VirB11/Archaellum biosynthesis ATPase n=1 Tax=Halolamina pelagica TaxID=699431 RepID=A0A1I5R273_9EURY|nr:MULTISPECIES: ATPase, T2SS/T4P/T4SS family [Halolamina]NHX35647.1 type II/IV secretion system ATPase subunit [Halolamina sp. R1-12]SFP52437.1 Type IV secretory pathway ATPase VirB11/Archaellum biosynthesis ATPase [Halolamina pelagica]